MVDASHSLRNSQYCQNTLLQGRDNCCAYKIAVRTCSKQAIAVTIFIHACVYALYIYMFCTSFRGSDMSSRRCEVGLLEHNAITHAELYVLLRVQS